MATLQELSGLYGDGDLINKISAAIIIKANDYLTNVGTATAAEKAWAAKAFLSPQTEADRVLKAVLAQNAGLSVAAIQGAADSAIQTNVNDAVQLFIDADSGA